MTDSVTPPAAQTTESSGATIRDDELVYVDPDSRTVVGRVEWNRNGNPKSMPFKQPESDTAAQSKTKGKEERRRSGRKFYPWGSYRSMKNAFKLEGKKKTEGNKTLDEVLPKALEAPFWD